jgi:hypothetical protein
MTLISWCQLFTVYGVGHGSLDTEVMGYSTVKGMAFCVMLTCVGRGLCE